jgi:hypothetical protein
LVIFLEILVVGLRLHRLLFNLHYRGHLFLDIGDSLLLFELLQGLGAVWNWCTKNGWCESACAIGIGEEVCCIEADGCLEGSDPVREIT